MIKFADRKEAGQKLAERLTKYKKESPLVLAIPRGGVVVATEVAKKLGCLLDVIITRKLGAPGNPELAIGATTSKGGLVIDRELIDKLEITQNYLHTEHLKQLAEARRREKLYTKGKSPDITGKVVILVDDGIATGSTIEAAIRAVQEGLPDKTIVAVPVAPVETADRLRSLVDNLVVLSTPEPFWAIGEFYDSFPQVPDEEVIKILNEINKSK
ncbi:MAG: hypothetical protein A2126_00410 [Candidatus Woykebacteria bacterium GWB1_45_5]|uniref:Phosphoribosyltransferase domain-containing protein n=2 Tax=Candidatus Woykeibacteriota TaxID=1817899 RepID=A0A1G1W4M3_9BACT|nr:MAG: hypothetical protein A2113_04520 [Candidatus Woykebacteria bacterium GWA1_44_8]OGY24545.1 MAG: hypothetical protein A2126_00410 [Candidatus Woykebacteria bacterium GWB1_45_5]